MSFDCFRQWKVGDSCRVLSSNGRWYPSKIDAILPPDFVSVKFDGYESHPSKKFDVARVLPLQPPLDIDSWTVQETANWCILQGDPLNKMYNLVLRKQYHGRELKKITTENLMDIGLSTSEIQTCLKRIRQFTEASTSTSTSTSDNTGKISPLTIDSSPAMTQVEIRMSRMLDEDSEHHDARSSSPDSMNLAETSFTAIQDHEGTEDELGDARSGEELWKITNSRWRSVKPTLFSQEDADEKEPVTNIRLRRRRAMLEQGVYSRMADLVDDVTEDDAARMVKAHKFMKDQARAQDSDMQTKIAIVREEKRLIDQHKKQLNVWDNVQDKVASAYSSVSKGFSNSLSQWGLWSQTLKEVNGKYGASLWQFFSFMRWLFIVNFLITLFWVAFVVVPAVLGDETRPNIANHTQFTNNCTATYDVISTPYQSPYTGFGATTGGSILAGTGYWEDTLLFYSGYPANKVNGYDVALAYFLMLPAIFIMCLFVLVREVALSIRQNVVFVDANQPQPFAELALTSLDYSIESRSTMTISRSSIIQSLRQLIHHDLNRSGATRRSRMKALCMKEPKHKSMAIFLRFLTTVIYFGIVGVSCYYLHVLVIDIYERPGLDVWLDLLPPFVVTLVLLFIPSFLSPLIPFEFWRDPTMELRFRIFRTVFAYIFVVGTYFASFMYVLEPGKVDCWETRTGQEFYRLFVMDMILRTARAFLSPILWRLLHLIHITDHHAAQFDVPYSTLGVLYRQALIWTALPVCPLLTVIGTIAYFLDFHGRKYFLFWTCEPPTRPFRISLYTFKKYLLLTLLLATITSSFMIFGRAPGTCGPFIDFSRIYCIVTIRIDDAPRWFHQVWEFLFTAGVVVPVLVGLLLISIYLNARIKAKKFLILRLKQHLLRDMADIRVLLRMHEVKL